MHAYIVSLILAQIIDKEFVVKPHGHTSAKYNHSIFMFIVTVGVSSSGFD